MGGNKNHHTAQVFLWWVTAIGIICAGAWTLFVYFFPPATPQVTGTVIAPKSMPQPIEFGTGSLTKLTTFQVKKPQNNDTLPYARNGQAFSGVYTPAPATGIDVYPIVRSPDNNYWPNSKVNLMNDGSWDSIIYIGSPSNFSEAFEVYFVSAPSDSELSQTIQSIIETKGNENLGQNLPAGINGLTKVAVKITPP